MTLTITLKATYENEVLLCNNTTMAVSRIGKISVDGPYGTDYRFKIICLPINVCNEVKKLTVFILIFKIEGRQLF